MSKIKYIKSREILDSRGFPTIETEVHLMNDIIGIASVPSGASTGILEAVELRDNDPKYFLGKGVKKAVENVNTKIFKILKNTPSNQQKEIDNLMIQLDGTKNKKNLGANSILSVSLAYAKASALENNIPFYQYISQIYNFNNLLSIPLPMMNLINGGMHANNNIDIQEFMIQPISAKNIKEAIQIGAEIFHALGKILKKKGYNTGIGDEGGYAPNLKSNEEALSLISLAVEKANYKLKEDITFSIDCAASEIYNKEKKCYTLKNEKNNFSTQEFTNYLKELTKKYPIVSIEDGQSESDWLGFKHQTEKLGKKIQLVGDDLFVTNYNLLQKGIDKNINNAILIKLNQIGTLTETLKTIKLAQKNNYNTIISHRSGETEDDSIADLAVGTNAEQIKTGSLSRSDRNIKYNRLIRIEEQLPKQLQPFKNRKKFNFFLK